MSEFQEAGSPDTWGPKGMVCDEQPKNKRALWRRAEEGEMGDEFGV